MKIKKTEGTILQAEDEVIRVDFISIGEGYYGDYNPDDPEDEELIRFDVYVRDGKSDWETVDDASYCTTIPVNTPLDTLEKKIKVIFKEYRNVADHILQGGSVKKLGERLSWI